MYVYMQHVIYTTSFDYFIFNEYIFINLPHTNFNNNLFMMIFGIF